MTGQWAPIHHCLIEESKGENELSFCLHENFFMDWFFTPVN